MPTLLQINTVSNWGSTGRIAEEIGQMFQMNGGNCYIAYGRYSNPSLLQTIQIGTKMDFYIHAIQTRLFDRHGLASKKATRKLIEKIKSIHPDIIHLHNIHGYYVNYPLLFDFLSQFDIPVVWTLHDCWSFSGHCSHYMFVNCDKWKTQCFHCPQKKEYPASFLIDRSKLNFLDKKKAFTSVKNMTIVPVSNWLAEEVKMSFLSKYPIKLIHNGVDLDIFYPLNVSKEKKGLKNLFVILGVASVWSERKGLADFIRLRQLLNDDCIIVLIGLTDNQIEALPKGIIGIKRTNSVQELAEYYSLADVFFNPTWEDNFPTTNLESLACGTPIITYKTGGSPEAIDYETGFVVEKGNLNQTVNIINQLKKEGKSKYRYTCRQRAIEFFNKKECYQEYIKLYNDILNVK